MTQFTVQAPDGQHIKVRGPEGATDAEAIAFAKENWEPEMQPLADEPLAPLTQVAANYRPGHPQFGVDIPNENEAPHATDYTRQVAPPLPGGGSERRPARQPAPLSDEAIDAALRANPGASIADIAGVPAARPGWGEMPIRPPGSLGRNITREDIGTVRDDLNPRVTHIVANGERIGELEHISGGYFVLHDGTFDPRGLPNRTALTTRGGRYTDDQVRESAINQLLDWHSSATHTAMDVARAPAPPPAAPPQETIKGMPRAKGAFNKFIAPHFPESEFANKFFSGMAKPGEFTVEHSTNRYEPVGDYLNFSGVLRDKDGAEIGRISRVIFPESKVAYHAYLRIRDEGSGIGKQLLSDQMDVYKKMGIKEIQVSANIDVGSYSWAKYGFLPKTDADWRNLANAMSVRLVSLQRGLDPRVVEHVQSLLQSPDPHALWAISDLRTPVPGKYRKDGTQLTLGQVLLMNHSWPGKLKIDDPVTMERFNAYVGQRK